ncbi:MAG: hypothetical protein WAM70_19765 [Pyrinomonadaceae bacterium]
MTQPWFNRKRSAFAPLAMTSLLVVFYTIFLILFVQCRVPFIKCQAIITSYVYAFDTSKPVENGQIVKPTPEEEGKARKVMAARYSNRLIWVFLSAVSLILCLVAFAASYILISASPLKLKLPAVVTFSVFLPLVIGGALYFFPDAFMPIMGTVLKDTIRRGEAGIATIYGVMRLFNSILYAASFSLVFAGCVALFPRDTSSNLSSQPADESDLRLRLAGIASQMQAERIVLYVGTLLLVIGIVRMSVVTQWALSFVSPGAVEAVQTLNTGVISTTGGFYTLITAAVYLPAAYILQRRAKFLVQQQGQPADNQKETLDKAGLTFSFKETAPRVLAILGPLLAGPIADLVTIWPK